MSSNSTNRSLVLASVVLAMFMIAIEATIVATAMPDIVARLGGFELYSWVFAGFLLTQTATTVLFGKLADLYGRRPILIVGITIFLAGSVLCGLATSMIGLIAFRLIQGFGAGAMQPVAMTVVADLYTPEERASIQGYLSTVWGVSAVVGPLIGGLIVEKWSWPWVFWINIPIGIATVVMLLRFLHEGVERKKHSLDLFGAGLFAVGISSLLIALTEIGQSGANPTVIWASLIVFGLCIPLFLSQEKRATEPMLDLNLWREHVIATSNGASLAAGMTMIGVTSFLAVYVQGVLGHSATVAGLALTMMAVGWPIAAVVARKLYNRIGMRATLRIGSALIVVGSVFFIFLPQLPSAVFAGIGSFVVGFGMGFLAVTCILMVQGSVEWRRRGSATASNVFARTLGNTLGAVVLGSVLNYGLHSYSKAKPVEPESVRRLLDTPPGARLADKELIVNALSHGLHLTFWVVLAMSAITFLISLSIPHRHISELLGGAES
jgi:EmrB/QacA subfamily drug resistance transporter